MSHNSGLLSVEELTYHLRACALNSRESQKVIYCSFYSYAMAICDRYTNNQEDAMEILNDGFLKIFKEIHRYKPAYTNVFNSFKGWVRKIMVYATIDHFRKNNKDKMATDVDDVADQTPLISEGVIEKLAHQEIIQAIQNLSPSYRTVLNLFVIGGFSHAEISDKLSIPVDTSKSNLSKARIQLQKILSNKNNLSIGIDT